MVTGFRTEPAVLRIREMRRVVEAMIAEEVGLLRAREAQQRTMQRLFGAMLVAIGFLILVVAGVTLWLVVTRLLPLNALLGRSMLLWGTLSWFIVDSVGSWAAGAPINVALNSVMMLGIVVPAWRIGRLRPRGAA